MRALALQSLALQRSLHTATSQPTRVINERASVARSGSHLLQSVAANAAHILHYSCNLHMPFKHALYLCILVLKNACAHLLSRRRRRRALAPWQKSAPKIALNFSNRLGQKKHTKSCLSFKISISLKREKRLRRTSNTLCVVLFVDLFKVLTDSIIIKKIVRLLTTKTSPLLIILLLKVG